MPQVYRIKAYEDEIGVYREDFSWDRYWRGEYQDMDLGFSLAAVDARGLLVVLEDYGLPDRAWLLSLWEQKAPVPDQTFRLEDGREVRYPDLLDELERAWKTRHPPGGGG